MANPGEYIGRGFPSPLVPQSEKDKPSYILKYLQAIYGTFAYDQYTYTEQRQRYIINRKYAEGLQSVDKYKDLMGMNGDTGFLNLDWTIVPILPKFRNVLINDMSSYNYKIRINSVDPLSRINKDKEKDKLYANMLLKKPSAELKAVTGVPIVPDEEYTPESAEEAELYMQISFRQAEEIAMEEALQVVLNNNKWDEFIKRKVLGDLVDCKKSAVWVRYDENNDIRIEYVDVVNMITSRVFKDDFSDVIYEGVLLDIPLHQLRQMMDLNLPPEEWEKLIASNGKMYNNPLIDASYYYNYYGFGGARGSGPSQYDSQMVKVLYGSFNSPDLMVYSKEKSKSGRTFYNKRDAGYEKGNNEKVEKVDSKSIQNVYEGFWVLGTDIVFNSGKMKNMVRPKKDGVFSSVPEMPLVIIAPEIRDMQNKSMTERMIPHADSIQLIRLKYLQHIAKSRPKGVSINVDAVMEVSKAMGQGQMTPLQIQEFYDQTGSYFYSGKDADGNPILGKPIEELENGIGNEILTLMNMYNNELAMIRDVTGLNEAVDGSTPDKDALVGIQKLARQASNNATKDIWDAYKSIKLRVCEKVAIMIQDKINYGNGFKGFRQAIGEDKAKMIELTKDGDGKNIPLMEFGMSFQMAPDDEERANLNKWIDLSIQAGELRIEDAMEVQYHPNVKEARRLLMLRRQKYMEEKQQIAQMDSQVNAQTQMQSAQVTGQIEQQTIATKLEADRALQTEEYALKGQLSAQQHGEQMEVEMLKGQNKLKEIQAASLASLDKTEGSKQAPQPKVFTKPMN